MKKLFAIVAAGYGMLYIEARTVEGALQKAKDMFGVKDEDLVAKFEIEKVVRVK